jgi:hypothetical protein
MALSASGLFIPTFRDMLKNAFTTPIDLDATSYKLALINNSATPLFYSDTAYVAGSGTYGTNEAFGTGWAQGGVLLSSAAAGSTSVAPTVTVTGDNGGVMYDHTNDVSVANTTVGPAYGAFLHTNTSNGAVTNALVFLVYFGGQPYSTNGGIFSIQWAAGGIFSIDLTP